MICCDRRKEVLRNKANQTKKSQSVGLNNYVSLALIQNYF